ncbi:hypothetical protein F4820DRAFT_97983 [Hypoxylon rubiginosum]|uniref:Uncharacterized protein n=1 Tax=Hypoxylon rubiginosum TaxID=110542 RepID=A0ACB9YMN2_9PEZI|nr:hypothetical protein F4820DRAFT_97983 [Hypoxylon rubiginosum]
MDLILDIQEREATAPKAPSLPQLKSTATGFPEHKKRTRVSTFKQKRQNINLDQSWPKIPTPSSKEPSSTSNRDAQQATSSGPNSKSDEREKIDRENSERLANMSQEEIEAAQHELLGGLDPSILQMLLKRANLDEPSGPSPFDQPKSTSQETPIEANNTQPPEIRVEDTSVQPSSNTPDSQTPDQKRAESAQTNQSKRVRWATVEDEEEEQKEANLPAPKAETPPPASEHTHSHDHTHDDDDDAAAPPVPPPEHIITPNTTEPGPKPHWPQQPQPGDLDPSDPDFLSKLHDKYFPSLPADPSKLAWMAPLPTTNSPADYDSPYHPLQASLTLSALRFDFRGALLPPRIARAVPPTRGLHHHGEAPEAAGYTVKELARLCRSAVPGQRCVAYQTLGRVLYRLGRGDFGGVGGPDDDMAIGVWQQVEEGGVMRSLYDEAGTEEGRGHRSARAFAIEAIWLYEKGGWKDKLRKARGTDMK